MKNKKTFIIVKNKMNMCESEEKYCPFYPNKFGFIVFF